MATLGLLSWLALRQLALPAAGFEARRLRPWAALGLLIVISQIALGGWVSANYAALACLDFPTCHGAWIPDMDFKHAFQFVRDLGMTGAGAALPIEALTAIQWTHRLGALVTLLYLTTLSVALLRTRGFMRHGAALALLLLVQIGLGIANVMLGLPLIAALAHNGVAAALLVVLVVINFALSRRESRTRTR
jgi:cytochrome c oxidase assembly protein subunit 15